MTPSEDTRAIDTVAAPFDVREFARSAQGSHRESLDLSEFEDSPLEAAPLRLMISLRDLERATMHRLRNLLVTATHKDARVTSFLTTWAFERFWLADALDAAIEANGADPAAPREGGRRRATLKEFGERRGAIRRSLSGYLAGGDIIATHVTTGLVDEWIMAAAYDSLLAQDTNPALGRLVSLVRSIKSRHLRFFEQDARERLAESERAQRLTRAALRRAAWPIGASERTSADRAFFERAVFGTQAGSTAAAHIEARVAELPGIGSRVAATVSARLVS